MSPVLNKPGLRNYGCLSYNYMPSSSLSHFNLVSGPISLFLSCIKIFLACLWSFKRCIIDLLLLATGQSRLLSPLWCSCLSFWFLPINLIIIIKDNVILLIYERNRPNTNKAQMLSCFLLLYKLVPPFVFTIAVPPPFPKK
jgi:hypothetical protein